MIAINSAVHASLANAQDVKYLGWKFLLRHVGRFAERKRLTLDIPQFGRFCIRPTGSDAQVMRQIFRDRQYDLSRHGQHRSVRKRFDEICAAGHVPVIIDAGANIGAASVWFATMYPEAMILAVEPDPENAACCRMNCARLGNVKVFEAAIGSSPGTVALSNETGQKWAVRTARVDDAGGVSICTVRQLVNSVAAGRLFIAKIDIEGFESDLFAENTGWLGDAAVVIIELHDWMLPGRGTSLNFQKSIAAHDFEIVSSGDSFIYFKVRH